MYTPTAAKSTPDGGHVKHFDPAAAAHLVLEVPNVQGAVWDGHLQRPLLWACVCTCVFAHVCMHSSTSASLARVTCMHVQARDRDVRSVHGAFSTVAMSVKKDECECSSFPAYAYRIHECSLCIARASCRASCCSIACMREGGFTLQFCMRHAELAAHSCTHTHTQGCMCMEGWRRGSSAHVHTLSPEFSPEFCQRNTSQISKLYRRYLI